MKLLFVHETKIKEDKKGNYYTTGSYNKEVWNRYTSIGNLTLLARKDEEIYDEKYCKDKFNAIDNNITFIELPNLKKSIKNYINIFDRIKKERIIKEQVINSNAIIARLPSEAGYTSIKYAKKYNKPYLVEVVGCTWDALWNYNIKGKILAPISFLKMKKSVRNAPFALYVTKKFLQHRYPCKGNTFSCSDVKINIDDEMVIKERIEKICNNIKFNKKIILGTVAAIDVRYKGQEDIIKAISKLDEEGYDCEYHLVGGGSSKYLKNIAEKYNISHKVNFIGGLPHDKIFSYLDNVDIYVQPSKQEGLPRALVEAMSRGCPVMGANTGGIPELVSSNFIFNNGDIDQITNLLKKYMDKDCLISEAKRSFEESKKFEKNILDRKRNEIYNEFKLYIKSNKIIQS